MRACASAARLQVKDASQCYNARRDGVVNVRLPCGGSLAGLRYRLILPPSQVLADLPDRQEARARHKVFVVHRDDDARRALAEDDAVALPVSEVDLLAGLARGEGVPRAGDDRLLPLQALRVWEVRRDDSNLRLSLIHI
eukprot:4249525-Prymnesium_polylepis.1